MRFIGSPREERAFFELLQQFDPEERLVYGEAEEDAGDTVRSVTVGETKKLITSEKRGTSVKAPIPEGPFVLLDERERLPLYEFLKDYFGRELPWGVLTGVKPVKLFKKLDTLGYNPKRAMRERYRLEEGKIALLEEVDRLQRPIVEGHRDKRHVSLYLGIPICPQRCAYCSFVSTILDKKRELLKGYLVGLKKEIRATGELLGRYGVKVDSIYIGGGTPSVLSPQEAREIISLLYECFDTSELEEFTFEAGRPEMTSPELLEALRELGVGRICINPQSMNDETLKAINRRHTADDIKRVYRDAADVGFESVNMDLICGLAGESEEDILNSLEEVLALSPENITVHDLSLKHGSALKEERGRRVGSAYSDQFYREVDSRLKESGYSPYYMYRQKYTIGNGENIGYAKAGKESVYNILMMAEEQTIIGLGAGSSGKLYEPDGDRFSHVFTVKDVRTYNERHEQIIQKKLKDYEDYFEAL